MTGSGDRLHDVRQRPAFHLDLASISYIPLVGPAAWAVYCYLVARAAQGDTSWPDDLTVATACGLSTYNARRSIELLIEHGLVAHHRWTSEEGAPTSYAMVPVRGAVREIMEDAARQVRDTDRLVAENHAEEERWRREALERSETRELFRRLIEALGVDAGELSEEVRSTVTEASRLARSAGATPNEIQEMIDDIREEQPDLVLDADRMLEYWNRLFRRPEDDDPSS